MTFSTDRAVVVIPTYCERESLPALVTRLLAVTPAVDVLIVDDNSPDGTGDLADEISRTTPRVQVLHRDSKQGLGPAYVAGFRWALHNGYDRVVEMDADGSHQPEQLPALLAALDGGAALAIGSRWVPGGRVVNWPWYRRLISRAGTQYARILLRSRLHDITSGYRAFPRRALEAVDLGSLSAHGYAFQIELAWRLERSGAAISEVPITFVEREHGRSKMTLRIVVEALVRVTRWGFTREPEHPLVPAER
ncbi:polyprenol monophosphomannose synthase [Cryobacterium tepidiphilum]|uniref:Polyprenol monophosphomannose synthase n=1 Tax=Cryobacterium tepidiphilum TaxID=2486026 RepID=A0A3M8LR18_9MICO|nr:polyprenol monophosphomannose synthase [Cryobacterium tepidiphilum]RNE67319.1 polyprenol monophosphomannose synthase [Cryobacterium tepidiphilum]